MASEDWSTFKDEEAALLGLWRLLNWLKAGRTVFIVLIILFSMAVIILIGVFGQLWAGFFALLVIPYVMGLIYCILTIRNDIRPSVESKVADQKRCYMALKRQEQYDDIKKGPQACYGMWIDPTQNWKVVDRWVKGRHEYTLMIETPWYRVMDSGWEDPLGQKSVPWKGGGNEGTGERVLTAAPLLGLSR